MAMASSCDAGPAAFIAAIASSAFFASAATLSASSCATDGGGRQPPGSCQWPVGVDAYENTSSPTLYWKTPRFGSVRSASASVSAVGGGEGSGE